MISRFFSRKTNEILSPKIVVGRYSDNNKSLYQVKLWDEAERFFKEGKFIDSIKYFFLYLKDENIDNVTFEEQNNEFKFEIIQGPKILRGFGNPKYLHATVALVEMKDLSVPVMRRLLEENFKMFYCRFAMHESKIIMKFDTETETANPNKLYYALKEMAVVANRQSYMLSKNFPSLRRIDSEHVAELPEHEKEIKIKFMRKWIADGFAIIDTLDANKNVNGICIILLNIVFTIDFFLAPHGNLAIDLYRIQELNEKKEYPSQIQRNRLMKEGIEKIYNTDVSEIAANLTGEIATFSLRQPKAITEVEENIRNANSSMAWYKSNGYYNLSNIISIYGFAVSQYKYSLPRPVTQFFEIFMEVNYSDYFYEFYGRYNYFDPEKQQFHIHKIENAIHIVVNVWRAKYRQLSFPVEKLEYNNLLAFNLSFTRIVSTLNLDL